MEVNIVYASTSGNTETVVETVATVLKKNGIEVILWRSEQTPIEVLTKKENEYFVLASSTWEHGVLNHFFQRLFDEMSSQDFSGKKAAFIGLGDMRYEPVLFNQGIKQLMQLWKERNGDQIHIPLLINGEPYHQLEKVEKWAEGLYEANFNQSSR